MLEWYDFAVYGYVAIHIANNFFPSDDKTASLLASFATFGVGFLARPFGGIAFGRLGDTRGRRAVLLATLLLMAAATVVIGLLPTYSTLGVLAPSLLVVARLAQGFSAGGETTTAAAFIVEWAPKGRRGLFGSFQQVGSALGLLSGTLMAAIITTILPADTMAAWGWRIPFLIGAILAPVGLIIRASVSETPVYSAATNAAATGNFNAPKKGRLIPVLKCFLFSLFWSVGFYFFLSYMPTFAQRELKLDASLSFWLSTAASAAYVLAIPIFGALSDRIGRKPILMGSCIGFALLLMPLFKSLTANPTTAMLLGVMLITAVMLAMYTGPAAATLSEIFPTHSRSSGMAVGYSVATVIFGGFTPFIATWLIVQFGTPLAPIYYVIACAVAGGLSIAAFRETSRDELN
jgi:MHS family proline/betaine transporter-like MFS transporter